MAARIAYQPERFTTPKRRPAKKPAYLAFLHHLPCCVTGQYGVEASHLSFASPEHAHYGRAKSTKAPDLFALPLSKEEHARSHAIGEEKYWRSVGIEPHALALALWAIYSLYDEDEAVTRCTARIRSGIAGARTLLAGDNHE